MVGTYSVPTVVYEVQVCSGMIILQTHEGLTIFHSYIVAAAMDGGTQVIMFILNFVRSLTVSCNYGRMNPNVHTGFIRCCRERAHIPAVVGQRYALSRSCSAA